MNLTPPHPYPKLTHHQLTYLFALIENSNIKFDYNASPPLPHPQTCPLTQPPQNTLRPAGRSVIACQRMMERMKLTLKDELEALKSGAPIQDSTPKKAVSTPRKRAAKENGDGTPTKRGRKKKAEVQVEAEADDEEQVDVKPEPEGEETMGDE